MFRISDRFDILQLLIFLASLTMLIFVIFSHRNIETVSAKKSENFVKVQSRLLFIQTVFRPLEDMIASGNLQGGKLKAEELLIRYPEEPYLLLLFGRIHSLKGDLPGAIRYYALTVAKEGSFIDEKSMFSARKEISAAVSGVSSSEPLLLKSEFKKDLYYLKSRLAGGCE